MYVYNYFMLCLFIFVIGIILNSVCVTSVQLLRIHTYTDRLYQQRLLQRKIQNVKQTAQNHTALNHNDQQPTKAQVSYSIIVTADKTVSNYPSDLHYRKQVKTTQRMLLAVNNTLNSTNISLTNPNKSTVVVNITSVSNSTVQPSLNTTVNISNNNDTKANSSAAAPWQFPIVQPMHGGYAPSNTGPIQNTVTSVTPPLTTSPLPVIATQANSSTSSITKTNQTNDTLSDSGASKSLNISNLQSNIQSPIAAPAFIHALPVAQSSTLTNQSSASCMMMDTNGNCKICASRYFNNNGTCQQISLNCNQFDNQTGQCIQCQSGLKMIEGKCVAPLLACKVTDANQQKCTSCFVGYQLINGCCVTKSSTCKTVITDGVCVECIDGHQLKDNECVKTGQPDFCLAYGSKGECIDCMNSQFDLINGTCTPNQQLNCLTFESNGKCSQCNDGYDVTRGICLEGVSSKDYDINCGQTDINMKCIQCMDGYMFNATGRCSKIDPNCIVSKTDGFCSICMRDYELVNGVCKSTANDGCAITNNLTCTQCQDGFQFDENNKCIEIGPNCDTYDSNGKCLTCYNGSNLINDSCQPQKIETLCLVRKSGICIRCMPNAAFSTDNVTCVQQDSNCLMTSDTGYCSTCRLGFLLLSKQCVQTRPYLFKDIDKNCTIWQNSTCIACKDSFWLNSLSICQSRQTCATFNKTTGDCLTCINSTSLSNGQCINNAVKDQSSDDVCLSYSTTDSTRCVRCRSGYIATLSGNCTRLA